MTIIVTHPDGTEEEYKMIDCILDFYSGFEKKAEICLVGHTKTWRFERNISIRVTDMGPIPFFHDENGSPIQERINAWSTSRVGYAGASRTSSPRSGSVLDSGRSGGNGGRAGRKTSEKLDTCTFCFAQIPKYSKCPNCFPSEVKK